MFAYILRRLGALVVILFGSSFLLYNLSAISTDPLGDLRTSTAENKEYLILALTRELRLDLPPPLRYFIWLRGVLGIFTGNPDFGLTREQEPVIEAIAGAIPTTIRLVAVATIVAIVLGIALGITSALRQYSRFDYGMTFFAFLLFSLPIFWVAVLLKQYLAIDFNDFLVTAKISPPWIIFLSALVGLFWATIISGTRRRVLMVFSGVFIANSIFLSFISATQWLSYPRLGPIAIFIFSIGIAFAVTYLSVGLSDRAALKSNLLLALIGVIIYFPIQSLLDSNRPRVGILILLAALLISAVSVSFIFARIDRGPVIRTSVITSVLIGALILVDQMMQAWRPYVESDDVNYRPVATIGQSTIWLTEVSFWVRVLDFAMHLVLPTLALTLISFAGYVRFSRGTLLDVLNQDYIRTARAKGLSERTVIMRHAFRNTMIPLTTIMVGDIAGIVGGAIITERVFAWQGMGTLFNKAINSFDLNLLMGVILFLSTLAILANLIADLLYSALDPRIRVGAGK
ncbi:MAG: ABC transporter permease subunit [Actinobacteria bacterium]|nr:ABC transporter permease subunit [Actinomycetota bacterium]NDE50146.1 ABC transporter permease subunit [Actinomycetota bacterium]